MTSRCAQTCHLLSDPRSTGVPRTPTHTDRHTPSFNRCSLNSYTQTDIHTVVQQVFLVLLHTDIQTLVQQVFLVLLHTDRHTHPRSTGVPRTPTHRQTYTPSFNRCSSYSYTHRQTDTPSFNRCSSYSYTQTDIQTLVQQVFLVLLHTLRDRSRCPDARATPSGRKTSFLSDSAYHRTDSDHAECIFFYIRCILLHATFSTPSWYTDYLFGTFLAH